MKLRIDPLLVEMARVFNARGKRVFLVGGAVRDMLRGAAAHDWDLASDALPAEVCAMFGHVIKTGLKHGTVTVIFRGRAVEVTTFRTEAGYADGRRPDEVRFAATVEEDLSRRDFTMNAVALELPSGAPVDPFGGAEDIRRRLIRCVGQAAERFAEDGLRPLRALRFAATLGFALDEGMEGAIAGALGVTAMVSAERVRDELEKIVLSDNPAAALDAMERTGLLRLILPELAACVGVEQKGRHRFDVYEHSVRALEYAARMKAGLEVRLAALLHDVGKPSAAALDERGVWTFYNHERASAELVRAALFRLRFPNRVIDRVVHLVAEHMFHYEDVWNDAAVRRFIARVGEENVDDLFAVRMADAFGTAGRPPPVDLLLPLRLRIDEVLAKGRALALKDLAVNGRDLMAAGLPGGRSLGVILKELLGAVLEDPELNTKDKLLEIAAGLSKKLTD